MEGRERDVMALPALATAHSHAFQRAMRGLAQRESAGEDFWSWRGAMYRIAEGLTPESMERFARVAYRELRAAGVRTVGEFHYMHHAQDGSPYQDRLELSHAVIRAARAEGLRICLLRVAYERAGPGRPAEAEQRRFCDPIVDLVVQDVEALLSHYGGDEDVRIGVAPHSVRATSSEWIRGLAQFARTRDLPFHMHVAEQPREVEECLAETGLRPVELLDSLGALSPRFVAVHATHLLAHEARLLGRTGAYACICPSTEADLGDGLPDLVALRDASVTLCTGIDSHVVTNPIAEMRGLETLARLLARRRVTFTPSLGTPAEQLWREGSLCGAKACGFADCGGEVMLNVHHPGLALVEADYRLDALVFSGDSSWLAL